MKKAWIMNDYEVVAADTKEQAVEWYHKEILNEEDACFPLENIIELPENRKVHNEDGSTTTVREIILSNDENGDNQPFYVCVFAGAF